MVHRPRLLTAVVLVAAALLTVAGNAAADAPTEADRAKARKLLDSANTHYNLGEWKAAIADYKECYRLVHNPVLLYNLGQAFRQDGDFETAVMFYRNYLRDDKTAANRADVERLIKDTEAAHATKHTSPAINPTARTANVDDSWTSTTNAPTPSAAPTPSTGGPVIAAKEVRVTLDGYWKGAPAVKFDVHDVTIHNYLGHNVHFGFNVRQNNKWLLWVGSAAETVKFERAIWPANHGVAKTYYYKHQFLRENGDANRPYEGFFYVVDTASGAELYRKGVTFTLPAEGTVVAPPPVVSTGAARISVKQIVVNPSSTFEGEAAVKFEVMDVSVLNQKGNTIHFGFNIKDASGRFLQWKASKAEEVLYDPANWNGATTYYYKHSFLREHAAPGPLTGRFLVVETHTGRELFWKDVRFTLP